MSETGPTTRFTAETTARRARRSRAVFGKGPAAWLVPCLAVLLLSLAAPLGAQQDGSTASIRGRVVDAESLRPLEGVVIRLDPVTAQAGARSRTALTDSLGEYRFMGLLPHRYRLQVERIGYLPRAVLVDLNPDRVETLSVGLTVEPILLPPVEVVAREAQPYGATESPAAGLVGTRERIVRLRQDEFLVGDARRLTHRDVVEAVTLGETDIFRALQRIPGVTTRDDYTATLWTRGASWDQTRVYFDGLPLFNPTHAGWLFSAVNPDAIGDVTFQPGHRSARWGEGSAAVLDLRSRSGGSRPLGGSAEVSLASLRLALDGEVLNGRFRWMIAGRRTYIDLLTQVAEALTKEPVHVPYDFADLVGRVDGEIGGGWSYEASGIVEHDDLRGDLPGLITGNEARWGNRAGQVSIVAPLALHRWGVGREAIGARLSVGETRFGTRLSVQDGAQPGAGRTLPALRNAIRHQQMGVTFSPANGDPRWQGGYQYVRDRVEYDGPFTLFAILSEEVEPNPWTHLRSLRHHALWGERRLEWERFTLMSGLRLEFGDSIHNGGRLRVAPRLAGRFQADDRTALSAAWSRGFQYTQDVAPTAGPVGPQLHLSAIWVLASPAASFPAVVSEVSTVGLERWLGEGWIAAANAYHRRSSGLKVPNPETGEVTASREPDAVATNRARGLELSMRRFSERWSGSLGVSFARSRLASVVTDGVDTTVYRYPAPADLRSALDATMMHRVNGSVRAGGAFSYGSGLPYTQVILQREGVTGVPPLILEPSAQRTPTYASLDLMVDYTRSMGSWQVNAYAQLRNSLNRDNSVTYAGSTDCGVDLRLAAAFPTRADCSGAAGVRDSFEPGLPRLPLFGVRVTF
jgi:hypothetical protein